MAKNITVYFTDGSSHIYQGVPDNVTADEAITKAKADFSSKQIRHIARQDTEEAPAATAKSPGFLEGIKMGTEQAISSGRTALGTVTGSPEEAARAGLARQEELSKKYGEGLSLDKLKEIYESQGILPAAKEFVSEIPGAIGAQLPNIGATVAGARLGARLPGPPIVKGIGAIVGAAVPSLVQQYGSDVERQAAEQQARGAPIDINRERALAAAAPQAALDVVGETVPLGRSLAGKLFGESVQRLLGAGEKEAAEKLAEESLKATLAKGTLTGVLAEVPTEVAQQALERWNAGLSLTDTDALKEYGDTALQVSMLAPVGAGGRLSERSAARSRVAEESARQAAEARAQEAQQAPPETTAQVAPEEAAPVEPITPEEPSEQAARQSRAEDDFRKMVLGGLQGKPTVDEFQKLTGLPRAAARAEMDRMVDSGYLQKDDKTGRYSLVPEFSQFEFTNAGEKPRTTLNEYPVAEAPAAPAPPEVAPGQMDLFQEQARRDEAQQAADKKRDDTARVLKALKQNMSIETIQNELSLPYQQARKYMMSLRDAGAVEFKNGKWQFVPEFAQYKLPFFEGAPSKYSMVEYPAAGETPATARPEVPEGQAGFDFEAPVTPKAPEAGKGPVFDETTLSKAMEAVRANGKATVPVIQKVAGVSRTDALTFMKDLRDRGVTNKRNEVITEGPKDGGKTGIPSGVGQGGDRTGVEVSVPKGSAGTEKLAGAERAGLAGTDRNVRPLAGGKAESEAALITRKRLDLPTKPGMPLPPETKAIVDRTVRAVQAGALDMDALRRIKEELKAPIPDYPFLHALIDNAIKPTKLTLTPETGEGLEFESLLAPARVRVIRNIFKREAAKVAKAEKEKAPATEAKAPVKEAAPAKAKSVETLRSEYSSRAIDALSDEKISEKTYENVREALKSPTPDFSKIDDMLEGKTRVRRAATEESVARAREAEKERKPKKRSSAKDIEDAADALLRGAGYDAEGELRFQRSWYYSKLSRAIDAMDVGKFKFADQLLNNLKNAPGVKRAEIEAIGLPEYLRHLDELTSATKLSPAEKKELVQEFLNNNGFQFEETVLGSEPKLSPIYEDYSTGAKFKEPYTNYRELLIRDPARLAFKSSHFPDYKGYLAHIRMADKTRGVAFFKKKILSVEEIQSDRSKTLRDIESLDEQRKELEQLQSLKDATPNKEDYDQLVKEIPEEVRLRDDVRLYEWDEKFLLDRQLHAMWDEAIKLNINAKKRSIRDLERAKERYEEEFGKAKHFLDTSDYTRLALKRILSVAAQEGHDAIEFIRGEEAQRISGGKLGGQNKFYNQFLPEQLRKLVFSEQIPGVTITPPGPTSGRMTVSLKPEARAHINQHQFSSFQRGSAGAGVVPHDSVVSTARELVAGWKNPPKVQVVRSVSALPERFSAAPEDTRGFYDPASKTVYVISNNAPSLEGVRSTVFHEALGHYGLVAKFRGDLDAVLGKMYKNPEMQRAADKWLADNPDTYAHLPKSKQVARAVEEVLAERSEAGPIKEAGLRALFNRLVAFVRDWARRHRLGVKYSNNDITQILRQAHDTVIGQKESELDYSFDPQLRYQLTPKEQEKQDSTLIRSYATAENKKPDITKEALARGRDAFSKLTPTVRRGLFAMMNQNQIANEFEHAIPGLRTRYDVLNQKGAYLREQLDHIADSVNEAHEVFRKYTYAERQRMFDIFHKTTLDQIEVLDDAKREWVADKTNPLYTQFKALPKEVRDVYQKMRETYDNQARVTLGFLYSITEPSQRKEFEKKLKNQRLKVYLPLFRTGDNWMSYTTKDGEFVKRSFETLAERDQAYREAQQAGYKDITRYHNNNHASHGAPPSAFFGRVMSALKESGVDEATVNSVVESYLDLMPAKSILQMARKREGTAGYVRDVVQSFANVATRSAAHITNLKYNHELEKVMGTIREEAGKAALLHEADPADPKGISTDVKNDLMSVVEKSHEHMLNPKYNGLANAVQQFNYITYLGGNVSTAFVTLMHMPTVAYPTLAKISGFFSAASAMKRMHAHAINYQFSGGKNVPADLKRVLEQAHKDGVIGERRAQDIAEFKTSGTDKYIGMKAKVDKVMNATLGAADKYNREVTLLASYDLNRAKLEKTGLKGEALHEAAYDAAKRDVYDTLGSVFNTAAANILQHPLGRMFFTFKQDGMHRAYLLAKAFLDSVKGESKEVRRAARKQLLGFYAMAGLIAGVQGMPLVGWAEMMAQLLHPDDDDDTFDPSEEVKEAVGLLPYKGLINYYLNLNVAERVGWDGMFWRDDPVRRSQLGFMNFAAEKMFGPVATYVGQNLPRAYDHITNGRLERAAETVMPVAAANVLKGIRYGLNGATTKDGVPIKEDVNAYSAFMQVLGFSPADLAEIQQENSARIGLEKKIYNMRDALTAQFVAAKVNNDEDGVKEVLKKIKAFDSKYPGVAIKNADLSEALTKHHKRLAQSVNGVSVNPKVRPQVMAAYPSMEDEDEDEDEE